MTAYLCSAACGVLMAASLLLWHARPQPVVVVEAAVASQEPISGAIAPIGILEGPPSLSVAQIDTILAEYGSPAQGTGSDFYNLGVEWGIDPAYALAFFVMESSAGTDPRWDGHKPDGTTTHDIGNISCGGGFACYGRWRDYPDWRTGIDDWYRLIRVEYIEQRGHATVDDVIPVYAPAFENDVGGYTNTVNALVGRWREETQPGHATPVSLPRHPVTDVVDVLSKFDTVNCDYWGFQANCQHSGTDFLAPEGSPVYAPFDLTVIAVGEYGPGPTMGQYVQGTFPDGYVFYAGHLQGRPAFAVGEMLSAGTVIGYTNRLAHSHVQLAGPGNTGACAQDGTCVDFERYYEEH